MEAEAEVDIESKPAKLYCFQYEPPNVNLDLTPIVYLPGFFSTNRSWYPVLYKIADTTKRKAYALDFRNHGKSEWRQENALKYYVLDFENFMDKAKISRIILVGHSVGGRVAMTYSLKHPSKVEKLVVEDIGPNYTDREYEFALKLFSVKKDVEMMLKCLPQTMSEAAAQKKLVRYMDHFFPEAARNANISGVPISLPIIKDSKTGKFRWDLNAEAFGDVKDAKTLYRIDLSDDDVYAEPVLFLGGDKSEIDLKDQWDVIKMHFIQARLYMFQGGYHTFHVEFPSRFVEVLVEFVEEEII